MEAVGRVIRDKSRKRYVWIGAVTHKSFKVHVDVEDHEKELVVWRLRGRDAPVARITDIQTASPNVDAAIYGKLRQFHITGLEALGRYKIGVVRDDGTTICVGAVSTFPRKGHSAEVVLGLGSCQYFAKDGRALEEIGRWRSAFAASKPRAAFLMLHMGDLHYGNIEENLESRFEKAVREVVTEKRASTLFRSTPVAYCWDDHDFGANNSNADSPSREAAIASYKAMVPHPSGRAGVYHAFTVANVRIIITDLRSEAVPEQHSTMSDAQLKFLRNQLLNWQKYDAIVWVSSRPWIGEEKDGSDRWSGYAEQRREIATYIAEKGIDNLVVVSGDAHMLAADDGSNNTYASDAPGFPVFHAAPLSNVGTIKGGPYSEGVRTRKLWKTRQYGILRIRPIRVDGRKTVDIDFSGYRLGRRLQGQALLSKKPILHFSTNRPFGARKPKTVDDDDGAEVKCNRTRKFLTRINNLMKRK